MPTHFSTGVSNTSSGDPLYEFGMMDPTKWQISWHDFIEPPLAAQWTLTAVSAGTGTSAFSTPDVAGGIALMTGAANENDGLWAETLGESFLMLANKKAFVKARLKVSDATQSDWVMGLHSSSTTPLSAAMRFLFKSEDGAATVEFNVDDNTTDTDSGTLHTMVDDTFVVLAAYWDGIDKIRCYVNGALTETISSSAIPGAEMGVGFGYIAGAAGVDTASFDYLLVINER